MHDSVTPSAVTSKIVLTGRLMLPRDGCREKRSSSGRVPRIPSGAERGAVAVLEGDDEGDDESVIEEVDEASADGQRSVGGLSASNLTRKGETPEEKRRRKALVRVRVYDIWRTRALFFISSQRPPQAS